MRALLARVAAVLRRVIGVPDYAVYLAHVRRHHPGTGPMTEAEFGRACMDARYSRPGSRCC